MHIFALIYFVFLSLLNVLFKNEYDRYISIVFMKILFLIKNYIYE